MSPKRSVVAPVPTTVAHHHKRRLTNVPVPVIITRPKLQQLYYLVFVLKLFHLRSDLADEGIRTILADGGEEESEAVTEHEYRHQDVVPRGGAMFCRRTFGDLLVLRDVSNPA